MSERRPVTATLRVIIEGYAADLEAVGGVEDLIGLAAKLRRLGVEPGNSPLLWQDRRPGGQMPADAGKGAGTQKTNGNRNGDGPACPVHGRAMLRSKHHSGYYCPEMLDDGAYCKERITE